MKRANGAKFVTSRAEEYRRYARQCLEIAPAFQDEERRATLLGQAQAWLRLAHLAQANRQIAELAIQLARQRVIVKHALDTGQRSEMAESLLDALEGSLRLFEKHRIFLLSCSAANKEKAPAVRPGRDWDSRVTGVTVTNRTVMDARSLYNRAISEI
jgi:hypothetical protein